MAIWDAVLLNDELPLLAVRLELLAGVVDHVVVVEATSTFSGQPKPLHFAESGLDVSGFPGQVHAVAVDLPVDATLAWVRENAQRAAMGRWLQDHVHDADLVLIGDVDELPRPEVLRRLATTLREPARLRMSDALYYANWHQPRPWTLGPIATRLDGFDHPSVRATLGGTLDDGDRFDEEFVADAGWHLSFLGGRDAVRRKLSAYSHQELNTARNQRAAFIDGCLRYGTHFAGWATVRKLSDDQLEPGLVALARAHPDLFCFSSPPARFATLAWCAWAWLRGWLPSRLTLWLDRHPRVVVGPLSPVLVPIQLAREVKRMREELPRWPKGKRFVPSAA